MRVITVWAGIGFALIGAINVWLILQASGRAGNTRARTRLIAAHRIGGYLFIALFCVMGYGMLDRLGDVAAGSPPRDMIHLTLAMVLGPLLFAKVLVARYYKSYYSFLLPIGLVIFVVSFVLIGITAGPYFAHRARMQTISLATADLPPVAVDLNLAAATMEKRCSKCHSLDRIVGARKDARGWVATVNRMRALPDSGISETESRNIVAYLASQVTPRVPARLEVARALVDQRCGRCHSLDRVYQTSKTPDQWRATVTRMVSYAAGSAGALQPGEDKQIIDYLSAAQTPDAVSQRKAQVAEASSAGRSMVTQEAAATPDQPQRAAGYDGKTIGFASLVFLGMLTLIVRRPGRDRTDRVVLENAPAVLLSSGPLILKLAGITAQTPDAKTLRFIVPNDRRLSARPGQFLTFAFLFDGRKVTRSYSICSSPARSGYVEITPKRVSPGCVSAFLNDRTAVGMTVEASGPFGSFWFDEDKDQSVVLLAAGSGITPFMAMLRYMDDLCLETAATLLYCVRTSNDIIFESELEQLRSRMRNFQYHVLLSQPPADWSGPRGHISREFIEDRVRDLESPGFFICGPPPFMDSSRAILTGLGVKPERIRTERFGGTAPKGTVWNLQDKTAGRGCANGRGTRSRPGFQSAGICADVRRARKWRCKTGCLRSPSPERQLRLAFLLRFDRGTEQLFEESFPYQPIHHAVIDHLAKVECSHLRCRFSSAG